MASLFVFITARPRPAYRGGAAGGPADFRASSMTANWSWGSEPASAEIEYLGTGAAPVAAGDWMTIQSGGHTFYGSCVEQRSKVSSGGFSTHISFADNRRYLKWDNVYGAFNMVESRIVNGKRTKRFRHVLPGTNYDLQRSTFTNSPYTAAQILDFAFGARTVEDPWVRVYHQDQHLYPVLNVDAMGGTRLATFITQISEEHGLVFTLMGGAFRLVWARKGEGQDLFYPSTSDNRESGFAVSENPTRIRVLGERNEYQVLNIPMVRDWKPKWETFFDTSLFRNHLWSVAVSKRSFRINTVTYPIGTSLKEAATSNEGKLFDPHQQITRQLASAQASEITVKEYADLVQDPDFEDTRSFSGKSRNEMPAILYINQVLFRAFKFQDGFTIKNRDRVNYRLVDSQIADKMAARVTHDPTTGEMFANVNEVHDGQVFATVRGYSVGSDLFKSINPDRFNLDDWKKTQDVWQHIPANADDAGDDTPFIVFDEPVIKSEDLVKMIDGNAVFKAKPVITIPSVQCSAAFKCEKFSYVKGTGSRDDFTHASGLFAQSIGRFNQTPVEIAFADGQFANQKAEAIATPLLARQFIHNSGKFENHLQPPFAPGTQLTGRIDRVVLAISPSGFKETVHATNEAPRQTYIPETELDRRVKDEGLFPGQKDLRYDATIRRLTAAALQASPQARALLAETHQTTIGNNPAHLTMVAPDSEMATVSFEAGTPFFKEPMVVAPGALNQNTAAIRPDKATSAHVEFVGVATRDGDEIETDEGGFIPMQRNGRVLARVQGPCSVGENVGRKVADRGLPTERLEDFLSASSFDISVGVARQAIDPGEVKLIMVDLVPAQPSQFAEVLVVAVYDDVLICIPTAGDVVPEFTLPSGFPAIIVAKPRTLRCSAWKPGFSPNATTPNIMNSSKMFAPDQDQQADDPAALIFYSFRYSGGSIRYRISAPGNQVGITNGSQVDGSAPIVAHNLLKDLGDTSGDFKSYQFLEGLEVIDPPYNPDFRGYRVDQRLSKIAPDWVTKISVMKWPFAVAVTPTEQAWVDAGLGQRSVTWLDLNTDARRFTPANQVSAINWRSIGGPLAECWTVDESTHTGFNPSPFSNDNDVDNPSGSGVLTDL